MNEDMHMHAHIQIMPDASLTTLMEDAIQIEMRKERKHYNNLFNKIKLEKIFTIEAKWYELRSYL